MEKFKEELEAILAVNAPISNVNKTFIKSGVAELYRIIEDLKLNAIIAEIKQSNTVVLRKIEELSSKIEKKNSKESVGTYAAAVSGSTALIVPKTKKTTEETKEEVVKMVRPGKLGIGIAAMRGTMKGGLAVSFEGDLQRNVFVEEVKKKMQDYEIKKVEGKNPRIKIVDISEDTVEQEIIDCIKNQNSGLEDIKILKFIKMWKNNKTLRSSVIIEVDGNSFKKIIDKGKINIGWNVCRVFEEISVLRCYKCCGYNHIAKDCKSEEVCVRCGSNNHKSDVCDKKMSCINCVKTNSRFNLKLEVDHSAIDQCCSVYKRYTQINRNKINYK